jgi:hypothetical protein
MACGSHVGWAESHNLSFAVGNGNVYLRYQKLCPSVEIFILSYLTLVPESTSENLVIIVLPLENLNPLEELQEYFLFCFS